MRRNDMIVYMPARIGSLINEKSCEKNWNDGGCSSEQNCESRISKERSQMTFKRDHKEDRHFGRRSPFY